MEKLLLVNPRKRRKKRGSGKRRRRRRNPTPARRSARRVTTRRASRRRNPAPRRRTMRGFVDRQLIPATIGASGALALDVVNGYLAPMLPAELTAGPANYLIKGAMAVGMGMIAETFIRNKTASDMTQGALTVIMHDAMREATQLYLPNVPLNGMGAYVSGLGYTNYALPVGRPMRDAYGSAAVGEYVSGIDEYDYNAI